MRLNDIITECGEMRPPQFTKETITGWINEVEARAVDEVINRSAGNFVEFVPYNYASDAEKELLVPEQHKGVYLSYVFAKQDYSNAEMDRYNNDAVMAESEFKAYAAWYRRSHYPKPRPYNPHFNKERP